MSQFQPPFQQGPQQPHTGYPQWQQSPQPWYPPPPQGYAYPPQQMMPPPMMPMESSMVKKASAWRWGLPALVVISVFASLLIGWFSYSTHSTTNGSHNAGMSEQQYKDMTTYSTIADLDKDGSSGAGRDVHFIGTILNFVKDSSGNTAGANVTDPATIGSIIQVGFPSGTNLDQLNAQDRLEVWGTDEGTYTGTNGFGATVHEVVISALYMSDQTTGYNVG